MDDLVRLTPEEYAQAVKEALGELTEGSVTVHEVVKNNNKWMKAVTILESDKTNVSPTIYLQEFYNEYLEKGFTESVRSIWEMYERNKIKGYADFSFLHSYEKVRKGIQPRLVNYAKNVGLLQKIPYVRYLDLAVVFYYFIIDENGGYASILVNNRLNERWGKTVEELYMDSLGNMEKKVWLTPLLDELKNMADFGNMEEGDDVCSELYILSNTARFYGAASILSKKNLKEFAKDTDSKRIIILPSSVHEALLFPVRNRCIFMELQTIVRDINHSGVVRDEDFLSDNVYVYDMESEKISIAG